MINSMLKSEKFQLIHRSINTIFSIVILFVAMNMFEPIYEKLSGLEEHRLIESEIAQIVQDEGYRAEPYRDSLGKWTIGFGHLMKSGENYEDMTPHKAVEILREDYAQAMKSVNVVYPWAEGDVRLVLINMTYQMGTNGVSKFKKTIDYLRTEEYDLAAGEMLTSRWAKQTPFRASRLAGRIMALGG